LPSLMYKIHPPYSPILLGVLSAKATPENVAFREVKKEIGSKGCIKTFHFSASIPQLKNIIIITNQNFKAFSP